MARAWRHAAPFSHCAVDRGRPPEKSSDTLDVVAAARRSAGTRGASHGSLNWVLPAGTVGPVPDRQADRQTSPSAAADRRRRKPFRPSVPSPSERAGRRVRSALATRAAARLRAKPLASLALLQARPGKAAWEVGSEVFRSGK